VPSYLTPSSAWGRRISRGSLGIFSEIDSRTEVMFPAETELLKSHKSTLLRNGREHLGQR